MFKATSVLAGAFALASPVAALASDTARQLDLSGHPVGLAVLLVFFLAYLAVMGEEFLHLRKSKPVVLAAGLIWAMLAYVSAQLGAPQAAEQALRHAFLDFAELMLFLLVAMTYINALTERGAFEALRAWLIRKGFGLRTLFWMTGVLAFFISPLADNLTTALLMGAVVLAVGGDNARFVTLSCINIVVAANAGGAFSPFGDITTLMVWQKGLIDFFGFFALFIPALVNWLVPAGFMHFAVPDLKPATLSAAVPMKRGTKRIFFLFLLTIATAVSFHQFLYLPPVIGMLTGLGYLQLFSFYLRRTQDRWNHRHQGLGDGVIGMSPFDVFDPIARAEWDTLLFFYGVVLSVAGLGYVGYLALASEVMYLQWGPTLANVGVGLASAVVDNIPVMFAVLSMNPAMDQTQWLLVTLTAGVGGSLLSIGSAAGVGLMGQSRGLYTFFGHLRWTPVIALGYFASIGVHLWLNG
jgi:NhaD family Na+/H+ antiporter